MEQIPCPHCQSELEPYDRRNRKYQNLRGPENLGYPSSSVLQPDSAGGFMRNCQPFWSPYKRYAVDVITAVPSGTAAIAPAEESTRQRWKKWYWQIRDHLLGVAASVRRNLQEIKRTMLASPIRNSPFEISLLTGFGLAELVRLAVNTGNWITTRSAMVTGPLAL